MHSPDDRLYEPPQENLSSDAFLVERHVADAMPVAHWHDHLEINWLEQGRVDYLLNGGRVRLLPRRLGVFWAAINHQTISVEPLQTIYCAYLPIGQFLALPIDAEFRASILAGNLVQSGVDSPEDGLRFGAMANGWESSDEAVRQVWREEILLRLRRLSVEPREVGDMRVVDLGQGRGARGVQHVEQMTAFIRDHLSEPIDVATIAAQAGLHPTNAQAAFRRVLRVTISRYLRRQRLGLAMRLLAESDLGMAEIAHRAGYSSVTRLYDAFKTNLDQTPRSYRAEMHDV